MPVYEIALLIGCHLHHALLAVRVQRREDPSVDAEVGVRHVLAFDGVLQAQRDRPEVVGFHRLSLEEEERGWTSRWSAAQACRHHLRQHSDTESLVDVLDRLDPKMSGCSSPPEARLSNREQAVCHPACMETQ